MATSTKSSKQQPTKHETPIQKLVKKYSPVLLPVGVMVAAFIAIFFFVLQPSEPNTVLKKAFRNTFDPAKITTARYNGSFGMEEENLAVEFSGQINGNDSSSLMSINYDNARSSLELVQAGDKYLRVTGSDNFSSYIQSLSVATQSLDKVTTDTLAQMEGKWVQMTSTEERLLAEQTGCDITASTQVTATDFNAFMDKFPFKVTEGPFSDDGDSTITKMVIALIDPEYVKAIPVYSNFQALSDCTSKLRKKDYKTRQMNTQDFAAIRIEVYINQSNLTIGKIVVKQFNNYFQIAVRDLNKDVTIKAPTDSVSLLEIITGLPDDTKTQLLKSLKL